MCSSVRAVVLYQRLVLGKPRRTFEPPDERAQAVREEQVASRPEMTRGQ